MPTILRLRFPMIAWLALCGGTATAQTAPSTEPALTFVPGEPRRLELRWDIKQLTSGKLKVVALVATRPLLVRVDDYPGQPPKPAETILRDALAAVCNGRIFVNKGALGRDQDSEVGYCIDAVIERHTGVMDEEPADVWTIAAGDEEKARTLVAALLRSYRQNVARELDEARRQVSELASKVEETQRLIADREAQIQLAEEECRQLGVADMTNDAIDSAVARFNQEQRLNQVDIAGIEASLASAKQRTGLPGELSQTLARIQVELEIQLVGKLARKDALARELRDLQGGRAARERIRELQSKGSETKNALKFLEGGLALHQKDVEGLEPLKDFTVIDNRVAICPIP